MANVGKLVVELAASTAQFQSDLGKAAQSAEAASKRISASMTFVQSAVKGLAGAITVGAFVNLIKGTIDAADHLNDLSKSTGVAVETLGGIGFAAQQSGSDLDGAAAAFGKLNLKIASAVAGNQDAAKSFEVIGISVAELKSSKPDEIFARIADKFASYEDGANKAALGSAYFGKAYQAILPLLDEGGDKLRQNIAYFEKYGGVTKEVAAQADEFNDTLVKIKLLSGAFARTLTAELLPGLQALGNELVETKEKGNGFSGAASDVATVIKGITVAAIYGATEISALGHAFGALGAQAVALAKLHFSEVQAIQDDIDREQEQRFKKRDALVNAINNPPPFTLAAAGKGQGKRRDAPSLGSSDVDDTARKLLEQELKRLDIIVKEEQDTLKDREKFLQLYYNDDKIGIADYFRTRNSIIADATAAEVKAYDDEIAALKVYASKAAPKDRIDAETKISEVIAKRNKVQQDGAVKGVELWFEEKKAAEEFRAEIDRVSLELIQLSGDRVAGASFGFDLATRKLRERAAAEANSDDEASRRAGELLNQKLDGLKQQTVAQAGLADENDKFRLILDQVGNAQARIDIARSNGSITELEALQRTSDANKARIADLTKVAEAYETIARTVQGPAGEAALVQAEKLRIEIAKLGTQTDLVADKFRGIFTDAFTNSLTDVITGTKSLSSAFKDMERSIVQSITRIAAQNIAEAIFGGKSGGSGIGSFIGPLLAAIFGGGSGPGAPQTGGPGGALAGGTDFARGGMTLVGERGPEIVNMPRGAQVIPNDVLRQRRADRGVSIVQHINVMPGASRATADQAALAAAREASRAVYRNG